MRQVNYCVGFIKALLQQPSAQSASVEISDVAQVVAASASLARLLLNMSLTDIYRMPTATGKL
jgi:hypothetical protein